MSLFAKKIGKPVISGVLSTIGHRYFLNQSGDKMESVIFGAIVGITTAGTELAEPTIIKLIGAEDDKFSEGKTFSSLVFQSAISSGSVFLINRYIFQNDPFSSKPIHTVGLVAATNIVSEFVTNYF